MARGCRRAANALPPGAPPPRAILAFVAIYQHPGDQPRLPEGLRERAVVSEIAALGGRRRELPSWLGEPRGLRRLPVTLAEGAGPGSLDSLRSAMGPHTLRLDDPDPTDPMVHRLDHDGWPLVDVEGPGQKLSAFLAWLRRL